MRLSDLLCRFEWYRRRTGEWFFDGHRWHSLTPIPAPEDLSDDISLRSDLNGQQTPDDGGLTKGE